MTSPRQFTHNNRPHKDQNHITYQIIDVQNKFRDTLHKTQQQNSKNTYMNDLSTSTEDNQE